MANSPESVWRNLAIALGDGLAFGVGITLTQAAGRQPAPPRPEIGALAERLAEMERRLEETRLLLARPAPDQPAPAPFDRKALEGVARSIVGAVEVRIQEQAARTDERLAEFQTRLDRLNGFDPEAVRAQIAEIQAGYRELAAEFHQRFEEECQALDERLLAVHAELCEALPRAVDTAVERHLQGLHARIAQSETRVTGLLEAIGQAMRDAAARAPATAPETPPAQPAAQPEENPLPAFTLPDKPAKLRLPLVSSFIVACGALALLRYLG